MRLAVRTSSPKRRRQARIRKAHSGACHVPARSACPVHDQSPTAGARSGARWAVLDAWTTGFSTRPPSQKMNAISPRKISTQVLITVAAYPSAGVAAFALVSRITS